MGVVPRLGQKAPGFSLPDANQNYRSLGEFVQKGTVVLAFFPFAFSGVCDKEMCAFRDDWASLEAKVQLVAISVDSVYTLKAFAQTYNLQFPLLSDFNRKVSRTYGVLQDNWSGFGYRGVARRSVFIADGKGILRYRWTTDNPTDEPPYNDVRRTAQRFVG